MRPARFSIWQVVGEGVRSLAVAVRSEGEAGIGVDSVRLEPAGTAYDRRLAARAAGIAGLAEMVALLVIVATDEGGPWALRLGIAAALAPVAGTMGALGAMRIAEGRGEVRALA